MPEAGAGNSSPAWGEVPVRAEEGERVGGGGAGNSSPAWGEVPVRAEEGERAGEYDLPSKFFLLGHQRPPAPSNLRGGVANALIDSH